MIYSKGFHPKPQLVFGPALGLGVAALGEYCDVKIDFDGDGETLLGRLRAAAPEGLVIAAVGRLGADDPPLSRVLDRADWAAWLPSLASPLRSEGLVVEREQKRVKKRIDVGRHLDGVRLVDGAEAAGLRAALEWPDDGVIVGFRLRIEPNGGAKPTEVIEALSGAEPPEEARYARTAMWALRDVGLVEPLALETLRTAPVSGVPAAPGAIVAGDEDGAPALPGANGVLVVAAADAESRN
jgi:radical SAM-linked protein